MLCHSHGISKHICIFQNYESSLHNFRCLLKGLRLVMASPPPAKRNKTMHRYLFVFNQTHENFRFAEFAAVCEMLKIPFDPKNYLSNGHLHVFEYESEREPRQILSRATLLRAVYEIMFEASDLDELEKKMEANPEAFEPFNNVEDTWKFRIRPQGKRPGSERITELRERFTAQMKNHRAPVDLLEPKYEFTLIEDFQTEPESERKVYFVRKIDEGQFLLKSRYNLRDRKYIGNSTMDPELAFIQANLIHAQPNALVLDPFTGTGGLLIPAAHFGSIVFGTEISYTVARGEGKSARQGEKYLAKDQNVASNFIQYNLQKYFGDIIIGDASLHGLWRDSAKFDAIIADPPYGIREKGTKIGNKIRKEHWTLPSAPHELHFPEKTKYSLNKVFLDLLELAAARLCIGGRVAFWFPVLKATYSEDVLPRHDALEMIANCEQSLTNKGSRRLLLFKKLREPRDEEFAYVKSDCYENQSFRDVIFRTPTAKPSEAPVPKGDALNNC